MTCSLCYIGRLFGQNRVTPNMAQSVKGGDMSFVNNVATEMRVQVPLSSDLIWRYGVVGKHAVLILTNQEV